MSWNTQPRAPHLEHVCSDAMRALAPVALIASSALEGRAICSPAGHTRVRWTNARAPKNWATVVPPTRLAAGRRLSWHRRSRAVYGAYDAHVNARDTNRGERRSWKGSTHKNRNPRNISTHAKFNPNTSYYETEDGPGKRDEDVGDESTLIQSASLHKKSWSNENRSGLLRFAPRFENRQEPFAFFGAIALNVLLGTVYCWSCYLVPLEIALGVGRGVLSWVFSITTVFFTIAVAKVGPSLYSRVKPATIGGCAAAVAGIGMLVTSQSLSFVSVFPLFAGYGLLFGGAAGVGYGLSVQISTAAPFGEGLSVGLVTSARAAGAFLFAPIVRCLLDSGGVKYAMSSMGFLLLACAPLLFLLLNKGGLDEPLADPKRDPEERITPEQAARDATLRPAMVTLWASLGLGVSAGLMVVSHAAVLLFSHGASIGVATAGISIVSACTTLGRVFGGWFCDREWCGPRRVLRLAPLIAAPALAWASVSNSSVLAAQCALAAASLTYGAMGSAVPTEVRRRVGAGNFARAYGKVYTAWGLAGLAAPAAAGVLYDYAGNYVAALAAATGLCLLSAAAAAALKPGRSHEEWEEFVGLNGVK